MVKLILLDLDDTLLNTRIDQFLPHYFHALGQSLRNILPPREMIDLVLNATRHMMQDVSPDVTNAKAFNDYFFTRIANPRSQIEKRITEFYEAEFPKLKKHVKTIPVARDFVSYLFNRKYQVVVATNPLFPARAIEHRMEWAGISGFPYILITTYENSHYCKPNPAYYKEILDKCSVSSKEALMIGDDEKNDIIPAKQVGIQTYHIINDRSAQYGESGTLEQCFEWFRDNER